MLILGNIRREVEWPEAGVKVVLSPLTEDVDQRLISETTREVRDNAGDLLRINRDVTSYARRVGLHCIKEWSGITNEAGDPTTCTPEAIEQAMLIEPFQEFIFKHVKGIAIYTVKEIEKAKKD